MQGWRWRRWRPTKGGGELGGCWSNSSLPYLAETISIGIREEGEERGGKKALACFVRRGEGGGRTRGGNFALGCVDDRVTATRRQYQGVFLSFGIPYYWSALKGIYVQRGGRRASGKGVSGFVPE